MLSCASPLRALALAGALLASLFFFSSVAGAQGVARRSDAVEPQQVRNWLMRIHNAAGQRNFQGTLVVSAGGGPLSSARIAHYCEGTNQFERSESLDGQTRNVFRVNEVVQTMWPSSHVAVIEQRETVSSFPALLQAGDDRIAEFYELRPEGMDRVAGHEANVLALTPRDAHRFGYRLWAEKGTGLLLRADVLDERGEMLETSAFSDLVIGGKPQPESVLQPMKKLDGYRVVRSALQPAHLEAEGWTMRQGIPGFRQVSCIKRPMDGGKALNGDAAAGAPATALQAIFSDGLTYVSVFIEPHDAQRNMRDALTASGATQTLRSRRGDHWVTVVGDVPVATLKAFADGLQRRK